MNYKVILTLGFAFLMSINLAFAHSPIKTTSPANEAQLSEAPEMLHLEFAKKARVLKVVMTHSLGEASHETRLELPTKEFVAEIHLVPEFMGAGTYEIEWRALGEDGHVLTGDFSFEVMVK